MKKKKTSKVTRKNYNRMREMKRGSEKSNLNKTKVSIKFGNKFSFVREKWTRIGLKAWLFNAGVHITLQVVLTLMKYFLLSQKKDPKQGLFFVGSCVTLPISLP